MSLTAICFRSFDLILIVIIIIIIIIIMFANYEFSSTYSNPSSCKQKKYRVSRQIVRVMLKNTRF
jgi:Zn-dependent membrane protease YugP